MTGQGMTTEQMHRGIFRTLYQLQNDFKEAEDEYLRLTRKRRELVRQAAQVMPVTELAKALRISRQKVYDLLKQAEKDA